MHQLVANLIIKITNSLKSSSSTTSSLPLSDEIIGIMTTAVPGLLISSNINVQTTAKHLLQQVFMLRNVPHIVPNSSYGEHSSNVGGTRTDSKNIPSGKNPSKAKSDLLTEYSLDYSLCLKNILSHGTSPSSSFSSSFPSSSSSSSSSMKENNIQNILKALLRGLKHVLTYLKVSKIFTLKGKILTPFGIMIKEIDNVVESIIDAISVRSKRRNDDELECADDYSVTVPKGKEREKEKEKEREREKERDRDSIICKKIEELFKIMHALERHKNTHTALSPSLRTCLTRVCKMEGLEFLKYVLDLHTSIVVIDCDDRSSVSYSNERNSSILNQPGGGNNDLNDKNNYHANDNSRNDRYSNDARNDSKNNTTIDKMKNEDYHQNEYIDDEIVILNRKRDINEITVVGKYNNDNDNNSNNNNNNVNSNDNNSNRDNRIVNTSINSAPSNRDNKSNIDYDSSRNSANANANPKKEVANWEKLARGDGVGLGPKNHAGEMDNKMSTAPQTHKSIISTSSSVLYPSVSNSTHVQNQRTYDLEQPVNRQRDLMLKEEKFRQYQQQERLQLLESKKEKDRKIEDKINAENRQRSNMTQYLNTSGGKSSDVFGGNMRALTSNNNNNNNNSNNKYTSSNQNSHNTSNNNSNNNSNQNSNQSGWSGFWGQLENDEITHENYNKKRKINVRDILDKKDNEAITSYNNNYYNNYANDNNGGYGNNQRSLGRDTTSSSSSDFWTDEREQEWMEGKKEKVKFDHNSLTCSKSGYVGYTGNGWNTQMQELKEKKMAARLHHQSVSTSAVSGKIPNPVKSPTSNSGVSDARVPGKLHDSGYTEKHELSTNYNYEEFGSKVCDPTGLDEGFHPKYLEGLSGVEGDSGGKVVGTVRGVFDVDQFIAAAETKKKKKEREKEKENREIDTSIKSDGKSQKEKDREKKILAEKKMHENLLQRLRAAAQYSTTQLSAKAISESLESVSIDSLLSQVLRFNLSDLSDSKVDPRSVPTGSGGSEILPEVPYRFLHEDQYIEFFHPLLIEEVKAALENSIISDAQNNGNGDRNGNRNGRERDNRDRGRNDKNKTLTVHALKILSVSERLQKGEGEIIIPFGNDENKKKKKSLQLLEIRIGKASYKEIDAHLNLKDTTASQNSNHENDDDYRHSSSSSSSSSSTSFSATSISGSYLDLQKDDLVLILKKKSSIPPGIDFFLFPFRYLSFLVIFFIYSTLFFMFTLFIVLLN